MSDQGANMPGHLVILMLQQLRQRPKRQLALAENAVELCNEGCKLRARVISDVLLLPACHLHSASCIASKVKRTGMAAIRQAYKVLDVSRTLAAVSVCSLQSQSARCSLSPCACQHHKPSSGRSLLCHGSDACKSAKSMHHACENSGCHLRTASSMIKQLQKQLATFCLPVLQLPQQLAADVMAEKLMQQACVGHRAAGGWHELTVRQQLWQEH